nr:CTD nuclear envelope phosphatase 1 homolog [Ipomoea batatas]
MADMAQAGADVYAPRSPQLWGALLNWLCFLLPDPRSDRYARPLVDKIDVENRFIRRLYRPSTTSTFLLQPLNGIPRIPFSAGQPHDEQLMDVILPLLKHLSQQEDVRPVLNQRVSICRSGFKNMESQVLG